MEKKESKTDEMLEVMRGIEKNTHQLGVLGLIITLVMTLIFIGGVVVTVLLITQPKTSTKSSSSTSSYSSLY